MVAGYLIGMTPTTVAELIMGTGGTPSFDILSYIAQFMNDLACL